jgi:hypothetical protein
MNLSFESKVALVTGAAGADADGHALIMLLVCIYGLRRPLSDNTDLRVSRSAFL